MKQIISIRLFKWFIFVCLVVIVSLFLFSTFDYIRLDLGTFAKSADSLLERSKTISNQANKEYQNEILTSLLANSFNNRVLRLDDLLDQADLVEKPSVAQVSQKSSIVFAYEFDNPESPRLKWKQGSSFCQIENGLLKIKNVKSDYLINYLPIKIAKDSIGKIAIRARVSGGAGMKLAWSRKTQPEDLWRNSFDLDITADSKFHTYTLNATNLLKRGLDPGDSIRTIGLYPSDADGATIEIDYIRFISKRGMYAAKLNGTTYETINNEMRHVMYMLPTQTVEYPLTIPATAPTLDFGTGILLDSEPVTFEIYVAANGSQRERIFSVILNNSKEWHDYRIPLSRWAGKKISLFIRVSGSTNNVAFWSNPLVSCPPAHPFNVIIILEDALRVDHLFSHGYQRLTSPVKEQLLSQNGVIFMNAVSQATKTRPSVPSLMTSLLPSVTGVWNFSDYLNDNYLTLAEIMRHQGFRTASFVQNGNAGPFAGLHQGFEQIFDHQLLGEQPEGVFGKQLFSWLERNKEQNFFVYIHLLDPHGPYHPPVPYDRWYREVHSGAKPVSFDYRIDPKGIRNPTAEGRKCRYDGEIRHNDAMEQKLLDKLNAMNISHHTLLVFLADHGEYLGEKGLWEHHPPGYLIGTGVPLMLVYPDRFKATKRIFQTVQLIDVMPTILELAAINPKHFLIQGDSLVDLIEDRNLGYWKNRICVSEEPVSMFKGKVSAVGSLYFRDLHLISSFTFPLSQLPPTLRMKAYFFKNDRGEKSSAYSAIPDLYLRYLYRKTIKTLQAQDICAWKKWTTASNNSEGRTIDPDIVNQLRGLGYAK